MRYRQINDYYLKDTYTGKKITLTQACKLLNKYENGFKQQTLPKERMNE